MHLNAYLDVDLVALENTDSVTVMLELVAPVAPESAATERPEHTAIVVLDRSGSMSGARLHAAKGALLSLVDRLDDRDRFGLVTFDDEAEVAIPAGKVGDLGRDRLRHDIAAVESGGSTELSSGYLRGLQEAARVATATGATVLVLSDGHANIGVTDPAQLRGVAQRAAKKGVTTSTIGIGVGYDEVILTEVATGGGGNHAFANDPDDAAVAVAAELDGLLSKTVQAASLLIEPTGDVSGITVLNDLSTVAVENGVLAELGDFYSGESRRLVITMDVPAMAALGLAQVANLTLTYVELATLEQHTVALPVSVNVVPGDVAAGRVPKPEVTREKLFLQTQIAKRDIETSLRDGDVEGARTRLGAATNRLYAPGAPPLDVQLSDELAWLGATEKLVETQSSEYLSRRVAADRSRKSRGYKSRTQGGEVVDGEI
ncbi:MAG: VWA domain-containing protein [Candidatus Nanopelagicales bacterium]